MNDTPLSLAARRVTSDMRESSRILRQLTLQAEKVASAADLMIQSLRRKKKILSLGNGGSAADAQHFSAELSGRFERDRPGLAALALTTNASALTAIANDYSYDQVFTRQMEGLIQRGDVLLAISTSGNSSSVVEAAKMARRVGAKVVSWTNEDGGALKKVSDVCLQVPTRRTCRVQEGHLVFLHTLCSLIEDALFPSPAKR